MGETRTSFNDNVSEDKLMTYGSDQTLNLLDDMGPLRDRIPQWAGQPVFVFMPHDLEAIEGQFDGDLLAFIHENVGDAGFDSTEHYMSDILDKVLKNMGGNISAARAVERLGDYSEFCFVMMANPAESGHQEVSDLTKIPMEFLDGNYGSASEWFVATVQHESVHCRQVSNMNWMGDAEGALPREIEAEQGFININEAEKDNPIVEETAYVPHYQRLARAIASLEAWTHTHTMSAHLVLPGEDDVPAISDDTALNVGDAVDTFRHVFAEQYASEELWVSSYEVFFRHAVERQRFSISEGELEILDDEYDVNSARSALESGDFPDFLESLKRLPEFYELVSKRTGVFATANADKTIDLYRQYDATLAYIEENGLVSDPEGARLLSLAHEGLRTFIPELSDHNPAYQVTVTRESFKPFQQ